MMPVPGGPAAGSAALPGAALAHAASALRGSRSVSSASLALWYLLHRIPWRCPALQQAAGAGRGMARSSRRARRPSAPRSSRPTTTSISCGASGGSRRLSSGQRLLGVPLGPLHGLEENRSVTTRSRSSKLLRPIPVLAWVPVAILIFSGFAGREAPHHVPRVSRGVLRDDASTRCSGSSRLTRAISGRRAASARSRTTFFSASCFRVRSRLSSRDFRSGVGVAWFSLVAAEMVSGEYGLGFLIWDLLRAEPVRRHRHRHGYAGSDWLSVQRALIRAVGRLAAWRLDRAGG